MSDFIRENNREKILKQSDDAVDKALEQIGLAAEGYAAALCPVQTGLLKNSITSVVGGHAPSKSSYVADKPKNGSKKVESGTYSGTTTKEAPPYVALGTNVEYAPGIELGTSSSKVPKAFIKPAIENHARYYEEILKSELNN